MSVQVPQWTIQLKYRELSFAERVDMWAKAFLQRLSWWGHDELVAEWERCLQEPHSIPPKPESPLTGKARLDHAALKEVHVLYAMVHALDQEQGDVPVRDVREFAKNLFYRTAKLVTLIAAIYDADVERERTAGQRVIEGGKKGVERRQDQLRDFDARNREWAAWVEDRMRRGGHSQRTAVAHAARHFGVNANTIRSAIRKLKRQHLGEEPG